MKKIEWNGRVLPLVQAAGLVWEIDQHDRFMAHCQWLMHTLSPFCPRCREWRRHCTCQTQDRIKSITTDA